MDRGDAWAKILCGIGEGLGKLVVAFLEAAAGLAAAFFFVVFFAFVMCELFE